MRNGEALQHGGRAQNRIYGWTTCYRAIRCNAHLQLQISAQLQEHKWPILNNIRLSIYIYIYIYSATHNGSSTSGKRFIMG